MRNAVLLLWSWLEPRCEQRKLLLLQPHAFFLAADQLFERLQLLGKPGKYTLEQLLCTFCLCRAECKLVPEAVSSLA